MSAISITQRTSRRNSLFHLHTKALGNTTERFLFLYNPRTVLSVLDDIPGMLDL